MSWRIAVKMLARSGPTTTPALHHADMGAFPARRSAWLALREAQARGLVECDSQGRGRLGTWRLTERGADFVAGRIRYVRHLRRPAEWRPVCEHCGR